MEKKRIERLYELLDTGNCTVDTKASLKWAIYELENLYSTSESKKIERLYELLDTGNYTADTKAALKWAIHTLGMQKS